MQTRNFDKEAAAWDENPARLELAENVAGAIFEETQLTSDMDALDFGCGTGLLTLKLASKVRSVTGADTSRGMLEVLKGKIAKQSSSSVKTLLLDAGSIGDLGGPYHLIVSSMTLHHVQEAEALLRRFYEVLRPSGCLCLADLDTDGGRFHADPTGVFHHGFDRGKIQAAFFDAGFKKVHVRTAAEVVKPGVDGVSMRFTVFLMVGFK